MAHQRKAIVVGTGAGGLSAAAHLAKDGFDVLALDQADRIGGFLAPFSLDAYSFDPGVHYVGQARRGELLDHVLGDLGLDVEKLFVEMDPDGFDRYRFPELEIAMCRGADRYRDRLIETFPAERDGLRQLFGLIGHYAEAMRHWPMNARAPHLSDLRSLRHLPSILRWSLSTFEELLAHWLRDPKLRAVLAAPDGDVGLPPSKLWALAGIGLIEHYLGGAFYPRGGSGALRDAIVAAAEKHGARFRTNADVVEILLDDGAVAGVRLADGEVIDADVVVSDVDPTITFGRLLPRASLPWKLVRKVEHTVPSSGTFVVYLGMRRDLRARGLGAANVWQYPTSDIEAAWRPLLEGRIPDDPAVFLSSSTLRDDSGMLAPAGCSTLQIVTFMPWEPFAKWADVPPSERGDDYRALRQQIEDRLLAAVERAFPGLVGDVEVKRTATPLSNTDYVRAVRGGIYGPAHTPEQMGPWRFGWRTPIDGLVLAGAGAMSCGVVACLASGRTAAHVAARARKPSRASRSRPHVPATAHG